MRKMPHSNEFSEGTPQLTTAYHAINANWCSEN